MSDSLHYPNGLHKTDPNGKQVTLISRWRTSPHVRVTIGGSVSTEVRSGPRVGRVLWWAPTPTGRGKSWRRPALPLGRPEKRKARRRGRAEAGFSKDAAGRNLLSRAALYWSQYEIGPPGCQDPGVKLQGSFRYTRVFPRRALATSLSAPRRSEAPRRRPPADGRQRGPSRRAW
jgi:hypothetical protein